ncbi:c-type cytochrome [Micromonospora echinospora]|uniref:c-type cytochrome n=1 Tax=Micromonospora echinospora TaxID=1877 RepID=UPI003A89E1FE
MRTRAHQWSRVTRAGAAGAVLALAAGPAALAAPAPPHPAGSPAPATSTGSPTAPGGTDRGEELYRRSCASCHGGQGQGSQRGPRSSESAPRRWTSSSPPDGCPSRPRRGNRAGANRPSRPTRSPRWSTT